MGQEIIDAGSYAIDFGPALAGFDSMSKADLILRASLEKSGTVATASYALAAKAALDYSNRLAGATAEQQAAAAATRDVLAEIRRLTAANKELSAAQKASSSADEQKRLQRELDKNTAKIKEAKLAIDENRAAAEKERQAVAAIREERRKATNETKLQAAAEKDLASQVKAEAAAQREAAAAAQQSSAGSTEDSTGGFLGGLLGKLPGIGAGLFSVSAIITTIKEKLSQGLDDYAALSGIQNTFKAIAGSAGEGAREYTFVKQRANELGLELTSTAKAYTGLYAAAKESNFPVATTRDLFIGLTAAGKVLDRSQEEVRSSLVAVEQMISKGTVSSQELKLQLGNALPGAFGLAARAAGLTTEAFTKQLAQGKILANDFLPKFAAVLKEKYVNATEDAAAGVRSNLGRINTAFQESSAKIGAFLAPAVKYVADFVSSTKLASEVTAEEQQTLEQSLVAITSLNVGNSERTRLIKELQAEYPAFLGNIDAEKVGNEELSKAIDKVSESLVNRMVIQKEDEKIAEQAKKTADALAKRTLAQIEIQKQLAALNLERQKNISSSNGVRAINDDGSVGFGVDFRKENQGLPIDIAAQNTLDLIAARKVAVSTLSPAYERLFKATADYKAAQVVLNTEEDKGNELTRQKALFMQALGISTAASTGALSGNAAALTKSIDALQAHRAEVQKQLESLTTNDYNDAGYRAKLAKFKADLDTTDALIKELQGKEDKDATRKENKQKRLLEAYLREQQTYKELAMKSAEQQEDDAKKASERQFQLDLTNIYEASRKLQAAREAAGQEIDPTQREQENTLLQGAYKAHYDRLLVIQRTKQDQLLALSEDGNKKEQRALDLAFEREKERYANQPEQLKAAIEKYGRDKAKLTYDQAKKDLDKQRDLELTYAESAALDFPDPAKAEEVRQQGVYAVKLKYALLDVELRKRINSEDPTKANQKAVKDAENTAKQLQAVRNQSKPFDLYKFILGDKFDSPQLRKALEETAASVVGFYRDTLQTQQQAAQQRAADATTAISELTSQLSSEVALRNEGQASNVASTRAALAEQREIRKQAQKDARDAAKEQIILDALLQAGNLVTSISNIFLGTSKLDALIPGLGIATGVTLSTVLVGAFAASKIKAYQAASQANGSFFTGGLGTTGYTGDGNPREESQALGRKDYTYHKQEFIADHDLTAKYWADLFRPLHEGRPGDIRWDSPQMQQLLPDYDLPKILQSERTASIIHQNNMNTKPLEAKLDALKSELAHIKNSNQKMAEAPTSTPLPGGRILLAYPNGSTNIITIV